MVVRLRLIDGALIGKLLTPYRNRRGRAEPIGKPEPYLGLPGPTVTSADGTIYYAECRGNERKLRAVLKHMSRTRK